MDTAGYEIRNAADTSKRIPVSGDMYIPDSLVKTFSGLEGAKVSMKQKPGHRWDIYPRGGEIRTYRPRERFPAVHRIFSRCEDNVLSVVEFAQEYGLLETTSKDVFKSKGEPVDGIWFGFGYARQSIRKILDLVDDGQVQQAAILFNERIRPRLTLKFDSEFRLRIKPQTLLGAMWLSVAEEISGGPKWRLCVQCGKLFPVGKHGDGLKGRRADSEVCSPACRTKRYEARKKSKKENRHK